MYNGAIQLGGHLQLDNKFNQNVFEMDKETRLSYLENLATMNAHKFNHGTEDIYTEIYKELEKIKEMGMELEFLVVKSIADILREIDDRPHFVGMGCSSIVAFLIGITNFDPTLNPIKHGLIFERGFQKRKKDNAIFGFYLQDDVLEKLKVKLFELYKDNVFVIKTRDNVLGEDKILAVNGVGVRILTNLERLYKFSHNINELVNASTVGFFTEDYMHLLHYVFGFSYEEANNIRMAAMLENVPNAQLVNVSFDSKYANYCHALNNSRDERLFDQIVRGIRCARSKAWVLSAQNVWKAHKGVYMEDKKKKRLQTQ